MGSTARPRTPSASTLPSGPAIPTDKLAPLPDNTNNQTLPPRRSSLGLLLRRSKSGEVKQSKKQRALIEKEEQERQRREAAAVPKSPPKLPDLYNGQKQVPLPYGAEDRLDSVAIVSGRGYQQGRASYEPSTMGTSIPVPPIPSNGSRNSDYVDPYARTESMTHRGRYSYASSAISTATGINSPRRVRRRKDPTPFNILIIGAQSSGKTSFLNFLKSSLALPPKKRGGRPTELVDDIFAGSNSRSGNFVSHYLETEIDGERVGLTLWDSEGLEKNVVDLQLREMSSFLESKFEETFTEEMKVVRAPGVQDTHIHCAFLLLDPLKLDRNIAASKSASVGMNGKYTPAPRIIGGLDEDLDLQVLRTLQGKTTVVPVISKADTITSAHMAYLKETVWDSLKQANLDPLEALGLDDFDESSTTNNRINEEDEDEDSDENSSSIIQNPEASTVRPSSKRNSSARQKSADDSSDGELPYLPLSIISPDIYEPGVIGRKFPWGFADPMNAEHCDFTRLKEAVFSEWRGELREASRELWYEGWRTSRLKHNNTRR